MRRFFLCHTELVKGRAFRQVTAAGLYVSSFIDYNKSFPLPSLTLHFISFFIFVKKVQKKTSNKLMWRFFKIGIDLLLRALGQLPSALSGLTALFGMGKGEPR